MKLDMRPKGALPLTPCHYGISKVPFRGPRRDTGGRFVAFLGGSKTFAKYIETPFPDLIEDEIGEVCMNLGCQSAGPDVFLQDTAVQALCHDAQAVVIQVVGAANQSNAFYRVHPRRNDRFIAPTDKLRALFPELDFTEIAFTGHLIARLRAVDDARFVAVRKQLEATWLRRMKALIGLARGPVVLLNMGDAAFVTDDMLDQLRPYVGDVIDVPAQTGEADGMCFAPFEELAARDAVGVMAHQSAANALRNPLKRHLGHP